jgi:2-keto-4-pentenoate hydratase/2-oxohepta-3-ene-1,7-dioic acid hydratase in catechol pathway
MLLGRFRDANGSVFHGRVEGDAVLQMAGSIADGLRACGRVRARRDLELLAPVAPSKVIAIGVNYWVHAAAGHAIPQQPLLFLKPPSAVIGPGAPIELPPTSSRVEFEGELAVVVGRRARNIEVADAHAHILGYTCANDVSARDIQEAEGSFDHAKGYDTFCPLGPYIATGLDPAALRLETRLNGATRQSASTADMVHPVADVLAFLSRVMTLLPGDVVLMGTPDGMGPLAAGDRVEVRIDGIGTLANPVVDAAQSRQHATALPGSRESAA